eukprot:GFKZ01015025.1.p2 GENE.GFKZ01015025.1~~GFKZ01015025.1.p2  ORF type:complete len:145 (+),score=21.40 GFKZ01015025.1:242-676(+)
MPQFSEKTVILALSLSFLLLAATNANATELDVRIIRHGDCSRVASKGDNLKMHYEGTLADGSEFDSSYKRGMPFDFTLGAGMVIKGWDQGLEGMCIGEVRRLIVPSHLGYGDSGYPPVIPEKATLYFKVELLEFGADDDEDVEL